MLGVALQTTGVFLVLSALRSERPGRINLAAAFAIFGLAFCVKQQLVAAPAISALLVMTACLRGRVSSNHVASRVFDRMRPSCWSCMEQKSWSREARCRNRSFGPRSR